MTFFESGGTDSSWRRDDDAFSRLRRDHEQRRRRRAAVVWSSIAAGVAVALFAVVLVIGPAKVATSAGELFGYAVEPPSAELVALADRAYLTDAGRELLYASRPKLSSIAEVADACERPVGEVIGCYSWADGIFLYLPADARVADSAITTLAHELLHAAYEELGDGEIFAIHDMLEAEIARVSPDDPVHAQIAGSIGENPESRETELFAYLGSQITLEGGFAPELEAVYARYFTDRAALASIDGAVRGTVDALTSELGTAYQHLDDVETANANERAQLEVDRAAHEEARTRYNADADQYNAMPADERARWTATWTSTDGASHSAPLGDSLVQRLADLESYRVRLDERTAALQGAEAAATTLRTEVEAQYADLQSVYESLYPGESGQ